MFQEYTPTELALIKMICALSRLSIVGPDDLAEEFCNDEAMQVFFDRFILQVRQQVKENE